MNTQFYIAKCAEMAMKQVLDDTTIDGISIREWIDKIVKSEYKPVVYARTMKIFDNPYTGRMYTTDLVEEIADVQIMIEQVLKYYFKDGDSRVNIFIDEKLTRQLGRIESEGKQ